MDVSLQKTNVSIAGVFTATFLKVWRIELLGSTRNFNCSELVALPIALRKLLVWLDVFMFVSGEHSSCLCVTLRIL